MLDYVSLVKGGTRRNINKIVVYNLYLLAHKGSGFDIYVVWNNLPQWRTVASLIKNGSAIVSLKVFNGYAVSVKKIPQCVHFGCRILNFKDSLKKRKNL